MDMLWLTLGLICVSACLGSVTLFRHRRLTTLLATIGVGMQLQWLFFTWLILRLAPSQPSTWYVALAAAFAALSALLFIRVRPKLNIAGFGPRDLVVLVVLALVGGAAFLIAQANGLQGTDFVLHGFYNGDVVTFASLVQRAIIDPSPVMTNPFAGNTTLEYPTLLHHSLGQLFRATGVGLEWVHFWPLLTYLQIALTIPLFFLLWDVVTPEPGRGELWLGLSRRWQGHALQGALTVGVISLSADNFVYPQSHFFLTGTWLLLAALLWTRSSSYLFSVAVATIATIVLGNANAVTGTAAVALLVVTLAATTISRGISHKQRALNVVCALIVLTTYILFVPGQASLGAPNFSYTAANDLLRLAPWAALLLIGIGQQYKRYTRESIGVLAVAALTGVVLLFSTRDIVVANASRFIYHALLIGLPFTIRPVIVALNYLRREFLLSSKTIPEAAVGILLGALSLGVLFMPNAASVASAYDNLVRQDEHRISWQRREAIWWLADHTPTNSIIIASPQAPWDIPLLSGRALLRTGYDTDAFWLSPDDTTLMELRAALRGENAAQKTVASQGDYLVLSTDEQAQWPGLDLPVFASKNYRIYKLR